MLMYPVLNNRPIDQWKVTELKDELRRRNLPVKGLKDDLVKRLFVALQSGTPDGGEGAVGGTPPAEDPEGNETPVLADSSVYQASKEQNVDEGPSDDAKQQEAPLFTANETSRKENVVANTAVGQEAVASTTTFSQEAVAAAREVSQEAVVVALEVWEAPVVDVPEIDEFSLSDAAETKEDDPESVPSDNAVVKEVHPLADVHIEPVVGKTPKVDTSEKMAVDDAPCNVTCTDIKLGATSADSKTVINVDCRTQEQEAVATPAGAVVHADPRGTDVITTAPEKNAGLIPKNDHNDNALVHDKECKDSKPTNEDCEPILSGPKDQVSEVSPDLGSQIKCASISNDKKSNNEKNNIKCNLNADNFDLELEARQEMVKPSSSIPSIGGYLQALQEIDSTTNMDSDKKEDTPEGGSSEELNLDGSSGDESMEEDAMESKQVESNIKSDDLRGKIDVGSEHMVKDVDAIVEGSSVGTKEVVAGEKLATPTEKRKAEALAEVANNEPIKRQCQWNADNVRSLEQQTSNTSASGDPKDVSHPSLKHSFVRSHSTASGDSPNEWIVPPPQKPATTSLRIDRFVRPFTLKAVQELLGKTGSVCSFWMDNIKTHCYVTYSSVEEAIATRNAVYNLQWPPNNGNHLAAEFVDPQELKLKLEAPPPSPASISPSTATTPRAAPFQRAQANQTILPHAPTLREQLPPPPPLTKPPVSDPGSVKERLPPTPRKPEPLIVTLDDLFRKTTASPRIYYLPLSEEVVAAKLAAQGKGKNI